MAMAAFAGGGEARDDHVRLEAADVPDDVRENEIVIPDVQRLLRTFRKSEVESAGEELFAAVGAARGQQLLRADDAEQFAFFVAEQILAAVAAGHRQVAGAIQALVAEIGDEGGVFIIGMRGHIERAADDGELFERELDLRGIERLLREQRRRDNQQRDEESEGSAKHGGEW